MKSINALPVVALNARMPVSLECKLKAARFQLAKARWLRHLVARSNQ